MGTEYTQTNREMGNRFEVAICEELFRHGWWVYHCPQNAHGQPADIICCINSVTYLIDCKVCTGKGFSFLRIEENQRNSMTRFEDRTNQTAMFIFRLPERDVWFIEWSHMKLLIDKGVHFLSNEKIRQIGHPLEDLWHN